LRPGRLLRCTPTTPDLWTSRCRSQPSSRLDQTAAPARHERLRGAVLGKDVLHCFSEKIRCGAPTRRGVAVVQRGRRSVRTAGCRLCSCAAFPRPRALHHWPPLPCTPLRAFKLLPKGFGPQSKVDFGKDDSKSPLGSTPQRKKSISFGVPKGPSLSKLGIPNAPLYFKLSLTCLSQYIRFEKT